MAYSMRNKGFVGRGLMRRWVAYVGWEQAGLGGRLCRVEWSSRLRTQESSSKINS